MNALILQNGIQVRSVRPGTSVRLVAQDVDFWTNQLTFIVIDERSVDVVRQIVSVRLIGGRDAWLDWRAPQTPGYYYFYPDFAGNPTSFIAFEVSRAAPPPSVPDDTDPGPALDEDKPDDKALPSWAIPAGIGAGVLVLLLVLGGRK